MLLLLYIPWIVLVLLSRHPASFAGIKTNVIDFNFNDFLLVIAQTLFGFHSDSLSANLVSLWPLLLIALFAIVYYIKPPSMKTLYLLLISFGILILMFVLGFYRNVFVVRYISIYTIPLILILGYLISRIKKMKHYQLILVILTICLSIFWADQSFNKANALRYDNGQAISHIEERIKPGDIIIFTPNYLDNIFEYYYQGKAPLYPFPRWSKEYGLRNSIDDLSNDLFRVHKGKKRVWLFTSPRFGDLGSEKEDTIKIKEILRNKFSDEKKIKFANVYVYLYSE